MKKYASFSVVLLTVFLVGTVYATDLKWTEKGKTVLIDNTVQISKPNGAWDTQKTQKDDAPVKWVYHQAGKNPLITLKYRSNVQGATAHDYAKVVAKELTKDGVTVKKTENSVINGRNISILNGVDKKSEDHYVVGIWRHKDKGFILEGKSSAKDFGTMKPEFLAAIKSVKIVKETSK